MTLTETGKSTDRETELRRNVRERYASLATGKRDSCCENRSGLIETLDVPREAVAVKASCGSPLSLVRPKVGEIVLDLGSGGGIDVFHASRLVGEKGKAIGVDATPEMVWRARETAMKYGFSNVKFRLGEIEALPVESESVDYVISNCVINLAPNKQRVFDEAYRVLRKGGTFAVADVTSEREIPDGTKQNMSMWTLCQRRNHEDRLQGNAGKSRVQRRGS